MSVSQCHLLTTALCPLHRRRSRRRSCPVNRFLHTKPARRRIRRPQYTHETPQKLKRYARRPNSHCPQVGHSLTNARLIIARTSTARRSPGQAAGRNYESKSSGIGLLACWSVRCERCPAQAWSRLGWSGCLGAGRAQEGGQGFCSRGTYRSSPCRTRTSNAPTAARLH